jgi:hypothetical protein
MVTASNSAFLRRLPILAPMLAFAALPTLAQTPANAPTHSAPSATGL